VVGALEGFLDLAAAETACADTDAFRRTVDHCTDTLKVGVECPFGLVVGVTDVVAGLVFFRANVTYECHGNAPSLWR
jgi:hypothetical protein